MLRLPLTLLFLIATPSQAQEPITVRGKTASIIRLDSRATGEVGWIVDERLESDERSYRDLAAKRLIVVPPVAGRYVCHSFSVEGGKPSVQKFIVIAEGGPAPPDPGPPVETIATKLAAAFAEDKAAGAGSDADKASLGRLYRLLSDQTSHPAFTLVGDAHAARRTLINAIIGAKLPKTVEVADMYCREKLGGVPSTPLTQPMRDTLKAAMLEIAAALAGDAPPVPVPPVPVPVGVRDVYIVRETADTTPELARLIVSLRAGAPAKYIKDKGHSLTILDKDAIGPDKLPAAIVVKLRPHFEGIPLPVLIVLDKAGALVSKQALPNSADAVIEAVKKAGG